MIVGIGELLWDIFPDGQKVAGGAPFNFAFHCRQLGHDAAIVSRVGNDDLGHELRQEVCSLGLSDEFIQTDDNHPTGTVQVRLDAYGQPTYTITENVAWDYIGEEGPIDEGLAHDTVAVCFGTLAQRHPVSRSTIQTFVGPGSAMPSALRVFDVNLRAQIDMRYMQPLLFNSQWVKLNSDELRRLALLFGQTPAELMHTHSRIRNGEECVWIVTRGEDGCELFSSGGNVCEPGVSARVVDTVGAGDAFTAAMVCLHLEGRSLQECARFANHYAARVCEHRGATPRIDRAEVEREILQHARRSIP